MNFFDFISQNAGIILVFAILIFLFWNVFLEIRLKREKQRINIFFKGKRAEDLEEIISEILKRQRDEERAINKILEKIANLEKLTSFSIQKVGVVRFNPFQETGGNQSFSLVFLNQKDSGVSISSYHSKEGTRIYTKPIINGHSKFPLSKEEEQAIKKAISGKP